MEVLRNLIKRAVLLGFIVFGLFYLNSTFFNLWLASGPPTDVPNAWLHRALVHFGFSLALFATAIFGYKSLNKGFSFKKSKALYIWLVIVLLSIVVPPIKKSIQIDRCLDTGGK